MERTYVAKVAPLNMAFPPRFLDEIRARVGLVDTIGRRVKLTRRGREHTGLCPFHNEKTPSFSVNEEKGFYHCFGCGAHGDVIGFVMRTEGTPFPEAVERLAAEAGLEVPVQTQEERVREEQRAGLTDIMEAAANGMRLSCRHRGVGRRWTICMDVGWTTRRFQPFALVLRRTAAEMLSMRLSPAFRKNLESAISIR